MNEKNGNSLSDFETCDIVEELKKREAVEMTVIYPHAKQQLCVEGPAIILVVYD